MKMNADNETVLYRSGAVARLLGTSQHKIRALARARLIESSQRNGYFLIPAHEVERLQKEGLPEMPANADLEDPDAQDQPPEAPTRSPRSRATELYAEPSRQLARSKEAVIRLEHSVEAKRLKQELRDLDQSAAQRRAQASEAQMRQRWRDALIRRVVEEVPSESCAATCASVDELLERVPPCSDVTAKVDEIIETALRPVRRREEQNRALEDALLRLDQSTSQDALAKMAARSELENALRRLPNHANYLEMRAAAAAAVARINAAVLHRKKIERESEIPLFGLPLGATSEEVEEARGLARTALMNPQVLPVGASDRQFRKVVDDAIAPVVNRINRRQAEQEQQQREAAHRRSIDQTVSFASLALPSGATSEEVAQAEAELRLALEQLPSNASAVERWAVNDKVLAPIRATIHQRREDQSRAVTGLSLQTKGSSRASRPRQRFRVRRIPS